MTTASISSVGLSGGSTALQAELFVSREEVVYRAQTRVSWMPIKRVFILTILVTVILLLPLLISQTDDVIAAFSVFLLVSIIMTTIAINAHRQQWLVVVTPHRLLATRVGGLYNGSLISIRLHQIYDMTAYDHVRGMAYGMITMDPCITIRHVRMVGVDVNDHHNRTQRSSLTIMTHDGAMIKALHHAIELQQQQLQQQQNGEGLIPVVPAVAPVGAAAAAVASAPWPSSSSSSSSSTGYSYGRGDESIAIVIAQPVG